MAVIGAAPVRVRKRTPMRPTALGWRRLAVGWGAIRVIVRLRSISGVRQGKSIG
jgi:hypothetical protein